MKKKALSLLLSLALVIGLLAACSQPAAQNSPAPSADPAPETTAPAEATPSAQPETRTVTDMAGREVTLPAEINSIATFGSVGVLNAFVELMGAGDKIANQMPPSFTKNDKWKMQYEFAPQIADGPVLENADREILIEEVLQLQPDLCLTMTQSTADYLAENGQTVIFLSWSEVEDVKVAVELMGEVLGTQDIADDYIQYFDDTVARAAGLTAGLTDEEKVKVLYGSVAGLSQPHRIAEWWISAAGAVSVTDDGHTDESYTYTTEDLLGWNPDVILLTSDEREELKADSQINGVAAIQNDAMYLVPTVAHVWGNRTVEQPLTILWTVNKCYPDLYSEEELAEDIHYFYEHFFLYDMSDEQIAEIIG